MLGQGSANASSPGLLHATAWAEAHELIDLQLSPLGLKAIEALDVGSGDIVLDIGCGAGQTLLQLAERVGAEGQVIGVDVAPSLLEIARRRTGPFNQVRLIEADAQSLDLPSASADAVFSRFGVMSFDDPVAAFANFRRILRPSGALAFCCWRSPRRERAGSFSAFRGGIFVGGSTKVRSASLTPNTSAARLRRPGSATSSSDRTMKRCRAAILMR